MERDGCDRREPRALFPRIPATTRGHMSTEGQPGEDGSLYCRKGRPCRPPADPRVCFHFELAGLGLWAGSPVHFSEAQEEGQRPSSPGSPAAGFWKAVQSVPRSVVLWLCDSVMAGLPSTSDGGWGGARVRSARSARPKFRRSVVLEITGALWSLS